MVTKSFNIFNGNNGPVAEHGDKLIIEIGKSHMALMLTRGQNNSIAGFELFTFAEHEAEPNKLFAAIGNTSALLNHTYSSVNIFINNECCIPVPSAKFTEAISEDFMSLIFGETENSDTYHDHLTHPEIINQYRVSQELAAVLYHRFPHFKIHHSWTNVLKMLGSKGLLSSEHLMHVQFYHTYFIAAVVKEGALQIIQSFIYENPEDVLYQLLNIAAQFGLSTTGADINVSGLIDPEYKLFRELSNYFKNITADKADLTNILINTGEYPRHYFTPFFNLVV